MSGKKMGFLGLIMKKHVVTDEEIDKIKLMASTEPVSAKKAEMLRVVETAHIISIAVRIMVTHWSEKMESDRNFRQLVGEVAINRANAENILRGNL